MRAFHDPNFSEFLLHIGNGTHPHTVGENVVIPREMVPQHYAQWNSYKNPKVKALNICQWLTAIYQP
ncbi:hypothetical protein RJ640_015159 [Escallonia rubra]|uniref:Uncharacterized protein n=1 Tax=Escallonia rubra TaxID=112253 RepID=A0AA88SL24_9ASTE|nr:hypothetical protein RJ640_015159 [Escallonia rubra]